jgi:(E)-4-hydroxy-3-methylbut-2-enyl-diphosphate synthase
MLEAPSETSLSFFQELAGKIEEHLRRERIEWQKHYSGVENLKVAVMGCIVNGPGESKQANIGISLPGTGEEPKAPVFIDGQHVQTLSGPGLAEEFIALVNQYVKKTMVVDKLRHALERGHPARFF